MDEITVLALRVLFMAILPLAGGVMIAGMIVGALQAITSVHDPAIGYGGRLIAAIVIIYLLYPSFSHSIMNLAEAALR